jgi:hypothetical protein
MARTMNNYSVAKNSTNTVTSDYESVNILFGLSPKEVYFLFGYYYDTEPMCSVALMEIFKKCQKQNDNGDCCLSFSLTASKAVEITVEMDKGKELYNHFIKENDSCSNRYELSDYDDDDKSSIELHNHLIGIVKKIDEIEGIYDFMENISISINEIQTKSAYESIVTAAFCITSIYIAYERNLRQSQAISCFSQCKKSICKNL